jgi:hypothetical protein
MRKLMTIFLAMICISVGFTVEIMAQSIIISVDGINQEADTLDFGARTVNNPKVDSFYVVNNSNDTLYIPEDAFFLNLITAKDSFDTFAEFELDKTQNEKRPYILPPNSKLGIKVKFKLDTINVSNAAFSPDKYFKRARVLVYLNKVITNDTNKVAYRDTIHVIGDRTERFMKPKDSVIVFDTMYLGSTKTDTLIVYNGNSNQDLQINIIQNITNNVVVNPSDIGSFALLANQFKKIPITYTVTKLTDSLIKNALTITSSPGGKALTETSQISLKSFIAFQRLEFDSIKTVEVDAASAAKFDKSRNFIILPEIVSVGKSSRIYTIVVKNTGSLPIQIDSLSLSGQFSKNFKLNDSSTIKNIATNGISDFKITFTPTLQGPIDVLVKVHTNLRKRIPQVKEEDAILSFKIIANAISGFLEVNGPVKSCKTENDTVLLTNTRTLCTKCQDTFYFKNVGVSDLRVNPLIFTGDVNKFEFKSPSGTTIGNQTYLLQPKSIDTLIVEYNPKGEKGVFSGTITFSSDANSIEKKIGYVSVMPEAYIQSQELITEPGELLTIPIVLKTKYASKELSDYTKIELFFSDGLFKTIKYEGLDLHEKLVSTYKVIYDKHTLINQSGRLLSISPFDSTNAIVNNDTLAFLKVRYFLSNDTIIEIPVTKFYLGKVFVKPECDSVFTYQINSKIIIKPKENSRCADQGTLDALFNDIRIKKTGFSAGIPFSGESVVEIQHFIPETNHTEISLYSITGEKVETIFSGIAPTELTKIRHPLTNLPKGVYYCELRTGAFRKTIPIVITQ